tara:strand:+ start:2866 stop:4563 length:1698 start_codon:yes stop_codon:yes gene_type:complete
MSQVSSKSAFNEIGLKNSISQSIEHVKKLYVSDSIPWVIGYSGGKDSTATLQLIWYALQELAKEGKANKQVNVISTDTLVENPVVSSWVNKSLEKMQAAAEEQGLPIVPHKLTPEVKNRFWYNLIGKGYPAPRAKFRWCTDRLKISPSNSFIQGLADQNGEAILVLGTRKAESSARAASMERFESSETNTRKALGLTENATLDRVWVYTPISHWTNDDVWIYLNSVKNPWDFPNHDLMGMYQGATEGGECPLVVDKSTQSCGDSRFGCYVCTMVSEDKSMNAMIANDEEKEWMMPLVMLRSEIEVNDTNNNKKLEKLRRDKSNRDFRRMNGNLTVHVTKNGADIVPGPYLQSFREHMLKKVLEAQVAVQHMGPPEVQDLELLSIEELEAIRQVWLDEKHEAEDRVPLIYEQAIGKPYPGKPRAHHPIMNRNVLEKLKVHCEQQGDKDGLLYQQMRAVLSVSNKHRNQLRRAKLKDELNDVLDKGAFNSLYEAKQFALERERHRLQIELKQLGLKIAQLKSEATHEEEVRELEQEQDSIEEKIAIITKSLKEDGYSSLLIETVENV